MAFLKRCIIGWMVVATLAACTPAQPETPTLVAPSETPVPTATSLPSSTPEDTPTLAPSATWTASPTPAPTLSPTPAAAYDEMKILAVDNKVGGWMLIFSLPGIQQAVKLTLSGAAYDCTIDAQYPDRLFCQGLSKPAYDTGLALELQDAQSGDLLYESTLFIPSALFVVSTPAGYADTDCPQRGENVRCETECRIAPDGNPCVVATCVDACGLYFSVHTCPADMSMDFASCTPDQWAYMKKLYQIP